jgi:DNA polymerase-3 subunit alpha
MMKLFDIVAPNQGKRPLKIIIKSKLKNIEIDSAFHVTNKVEELAVHIDGVSIE